MTRHRILTALATLVLVAFAASTRAATEGWTVDFAAAQKTAAEEGKDILMDFTGSDWCGFCIKLHNNVFVKEEFTSVAPKHFVLVTLDYPNDKSHQTAEEIKQNEQLKEAYPVGGFPTIILADAKGRPYARMVGYGGTPAKAYTDNLLEQAKVRQARDENLKKAEAASGVEKAKLIDTALDEIDEEIVLAFYQPEIEQIVKLDEKDEAGLKSKYNDKLLLGKAKAKLKEIMAGARREKPEAIVAKIDAMVKELELKGVALQEVLYAKGALLYQSDKAASKAALEAAIEAAPDSDKADRLRATLERAFGE